MSLTIAYTFICIVAFIMLGIGYYGTYIRKRR